MRWHPPAPLPRAHQGPDRGATSKHQSGNRAFWCAVEGIKLAEEGRREKAMRWLGFCQGVCFALGYATVDDLKKMSMPDPEPAT